MQQTTCLLGFPKGRFPPYLPGRLRVLAGSFLAGAPKKSLLTHFGHSALDIAVPHNAAVLNKGQRHREGLNWEVLANPISSPDHPERVSCTAAGLSSSTRAGRTGYKATRSAFVLFCCVNVPNVQSRYSRDCKKIYNALDSEISSIYPFQRCVVPRTDWA